MNLLYFFATIGMMSTVFVPSSPNTPPSLIMSGTTLPSAVVHVIIDSAETYEQADDSGHFTVEAWGLGVGQHDVLIRAANSQGQSPQKEMVVELTPDVSTVNLSNIDLPIAKPTLPDTLLRFDLNQDGKFDFKDISLFLIKYHGADKSLDFNYDGRVNLTDFSIVISYYLSISR